MESSQKKFQVEGIVLVGDNTIRNAWPMTQILKTFSDKKGLVRSVQLAIGKIFPNSKEISVFEQPVNK